ncbi:MAG TPA: hypothetical protein GXX75_03385 [Clostridiales bacterium]|nr:hypothetical protein [Clostridiales bacterium]
MADYKRMISYMYQYENGVKRRNVGYARIESKNGQLKITLHMQLLGQLDSIFPTYLIQRDKHNMELIYLGDSVLKGQMLDSKLTADAENIMNSGYRLSDTGGLLLFLNENVFFGTEWDDTPIVAKEVMAALKPKSQQGSLGEKRQEKGKTEETVLAKAPEIKEVLKEGPEIIQTSKLQEDFPGIEDSISGLTIEEQLAIPKYQLPRGWKTIERLYKPPQEKNGKGIHPSEFFDLPEMSSNQDISDLFFRPEAGENSSRKEKQGDRTADGAPADEGQMSEDAGQTGEDAWQTGEDAGQTGEDAWQTGEDAGQTGEDAWQIDEDTGQTGEGAGQTGEDAGQTGEGTEQRGGNLDRSGAGEAREPGQEQQPQPEHPTAKYFFENFTRIYPFEDNEIIFCVKIEPKDIGMLPKETWSLSNNSFLMHGFYCYHHLIFAKKKDRYGSQYIIGIPGIFHNRECFMAKMFGFESFKSIRKRELQQGDFGYWYLPVNFNSETD